MSRLKEALDEAQGYQLGFSAKKSRSLEPGSKPSSAPDPFPADRLNPIWISLVLLTGIFIGSLFLIPFMILAVAN